VLLCGGAKRERQRLQLDLIGSILSCPFFRCLAIDHGSWLGAQSSRGARALAAASRGQAPRPEGSRWLETSTRRGLDAYK
jgi:hypothetical protein